MKEQCLLIVLPLLLLGLKLNSQANLIVGETILNGPPVNRTMSNSKFIQSPDTNRGQSRSSMLGTVLFDQGELINYAGQGFGGADASGLTGQFYGVSANIASNFILADDFVIPPGELWIIDSIVVFNYQTGSTTSSTINDIRMQIRVGNIPGTGTIKFGDLTTNRLANTHFSGIYRTLPTALTNTQRPIMRSMVNTNALSLTSGIYMMEHLVGGTLASGPFSPLRTTNTTHTATGDGFQFNVTWNSIFELDGNGNNPLPKAVAMIIYGISIEDKAAELNGVEYNSLQEAIDAATNDGDEITLLKNLNETVINVGVNNRSVVLKANGYTCIIDQLIIANGEYLRWIEDTLTITGSINNNSTGILWNNASIESFSFTNTGIYKGTGSFIGNLNNQHIVQPGN